ncbi:MAG: tetratricopeptide repeat protein [Acidobacteriota bacterium]
MKLKRLGLFFLLLLLTCGGLEAASPKVILVFPLENMSGNANLGWMSEGIANLLATRLASPTRYVIQRSQRDTAYEQLDLPLETPLTLASEYKVAQALGANIAIVGHFTVVGDQLTTQVQWFNIPGLKLSPPIVVAGKMIELDQLETRLAWELLGSQDKDAMAGTEEQFSNRFPPVRLDAFESYIRGILSTDSKSRVHFLQQSDHLDPSDHRAAFELGRYYFDQESYADSAQWLQKLDSGDSDYAQSLFLLGTEEYFLGHDASAEKVLQKLAVTVPLGEVFNNLGVVELHLGHYDQALADFTRAFQKSQSDTDYAFNVSLTLWYLKKYDKASQYLHKVLAQDPEDADAHTLLSEVAGELGDVKTRESEMAWISNHGQESADDPSTDSNANGGDAAPALSPRIKKKYDGRAFRLLALAITRARQSRLDQEPAHVVRSDGEAHLKRGLDLLAAGATAKAEQELTQAVLLLPGDGQAHQALGEAYEREGKHTLAATELECSLREENSFKAHLWLARAYVSLDHLQPALQQARAALLLESSNAEAKQLVSRIQARLSAHRDKP